MIFPVARFAFADEVAGVVGESLLFGRFVVDGPVFREVVKVEVFQQRLDLLLRQSFAQKGADFVDFPAQVLRFNQSLRSQCSVQKKMC